MIYYRIAAQKYHSNEWEWKSALLESLDELSRFSRQYGFMLPNTLRVFMASDSEYLDVLLARENLRLSSNSLTLEQFREQQQHITDQSVLIFEAGLGWHEAEVEEPQPVSIPGEETAATAEAEPEYVPMSVSDPDFQFDPEPWGGDHDEPYTFTFPEYTPHALAWVKLRAKVLAGELVS